MTRAQWKGHLTFGLVNVPVELHGAVEDNTPRFRMLHKTDLSPIGMERVCQTDGEPVAREIKLALQLIEGAVAAWDPQRYKDDYTRRIDSRPTSGTSPRMSSA